MKFQFIYIILAAASFLACNKDDNNPGGGVNFSGNYAGNITVTTNGTVTQTLTAHILGVDHNGPSITLTNNVFSANKGTISGSLLTLEKKFVAVSPTTNLEQYGTATFTSSSVIINFREDERDFNTNAVLNTKTWSGTLLKQ